MLPKKIAQLFTTTLTLSFLKNLLMHNFLLTLSLLKFCQSYQSHEFFINLMNLLSIFYVLTNFMKTKPRPYQFYEVFTNLMKTKILSIFYVFMKISQGINTVI